MKSWAVHPEAAGRKVLFCRSGGGLPGLQIHAGIWCALAEQGVFSTQNTGTSAGAIAAAFDSEGHTPGRFWSILQGLRTEDVAVARPFWRLRLPWIDYVLKHEPIKRLLDLHLTQFSKLKKPLRTFMADSVGFPDWCDGEAGDVFALKAAVLASMSIAGVFPPVRDFMNDGYTDGGTWNNYALPREWQAFDEVWLLVAGGAVGQAAGRRASVIERLASNVTMFGRGQAGQVLLETGIVPAAGSDAERDAALDALLDRGWASVDRVSPFSGRVQKVRVLWPQVSTDGVLKFRHRLAEVALEEAQRALREMGTAEAVRGAEKNLNTEGKKL